MIDHLSRQPIYQQIIRQLEHFIVVGAVNAGDEMPSVRALSVELCVNPNTIQKAYAELSGRGLLCSVPGKGCFVAPDAVQIVTRMRRERLGDLEKTVSELALAGIDRQEIITLIEQIYATLDRKEEHV